MGLSSAVRSANYFRDNPEKYRANQKRYNQKKQAFIEALKDVPCADCGIKYPPVCMDFDHLPQYEKKFTISRSTHITVEALLLEVAKCEVVCANCHRIRTANRRIGD